MAIAERMEFVNSGIKHWQEEQLAKLSGVPQGSVSTEVLTHAKVQFEKELIPILDRYYRALELVEESRKKFPVTQGIVEDSRSTQEVMASHELKRHLDLAKKKYQESIGIC